MKLRELLSILSEFDPDTDVSVSGAWLEMRDGRQLDVNEWEQVEVLVVE